MKRKYELTVIVKENDPDKKGGIEVVEKTLSAHGVEILKKDEIGVRTFAYEIQKSMRGFYCFYVIESDAQEITGISSELRLSHLIVRFLFVEKDDLTVNQRAKRERRESKIRAHLAKKAKNSNASAATENTSSEEKVQE